MKTNSGRLAWPDVAKGIAILLVVLGHVLGGLMPGGFLSRLPWCPWLYQFIYLFHMPVFFFVAGWLMERRVRGGKPISAPQVAGTLLYPFFLWGAVSWVAHRAGDLFGATNQHAAAWIPWNLVRPASVGPWFLLMLALFHLVYALLQNSPRRCWWCLFIAMAVFADFAVFQKADVETLLGLFGRDMIFYALGTCAVVPGLSLRFPVGHGGLVAGGLGLLAVLAALSTQFPESVPVARLPFGLVGLSGVLILSFGLSDSLPGGPLAFVGRYSLAIYLMHGFAHPAARWLLTQKLHLNDPTLLLLLCTVAGVVFPLIAAVLVDRWRLHWVFQWTNSSVAKA